MLAVVLVCALLTMPAALDALLTIVGSQTMQKYGWKIGDRVTLRSTVWPLNLDFRIVGEMPHDRATQLWMNWTYLDEALKAQGRPGLGVVPIIWVRASDANRVDEI